MSAHDNFTVSRSQLQAIANELSAVLTQVISQKQWRGIHCQGAVATLTSAHVNLVAMLDGDPSSIQGDDSATVAHQADGELPSSMPGRLREAMPDEGASEQSAQLSDDSATAARFGFEAAPSGHIEKPRQKTDKRRNT
jgi:hypothetical protein